MDLELTRRLGRLFDRGRPVRTAAVGKLALRKPRRSQLRRPAGRRKAPLAEHTSTRALQRGALYLNVRKLTALCDTSNS